MAGFEAVISGAFVSAAINGVVKTAHAYFAARYEENKSIKVMLDNLNASLPRIQSVLEFADQKPFEKNEYLAEWMQQLKDVIYEAEDVMDDFEAIQIRDSLKNKSKVSEIANSSAKVVKSVLPLTNDEIKLKALVEKIEIICNTIPDLITLVKESGNNSANDGSSGSSTEETSSFLPKSKKIFGRDTEIESILNMIIPNRRPDAPPNQRPDTKRKERVESSDNSGQTVGSTTDKISRLKVSNSFMGDPRLNVPSNQRPDAPPNQRPGAEPKEKAGSSDDSDQTVSFAYLAIGNPRIKVLPIVGIGGIGKTTIAQVIYNHERVRKYFDIQGWVYVTSSPHAKKFVYDILYAFDEETSESNRSTTSLEYGHYRLIESIEQKRVLLVFDDLREGIDWITSTWKRLIEVLTCVPCECVIIVTTHSNSIATMIGTLPTLMLDYLPEQQFLNLFEYYAFGHDMDQHSTLTKHEEIMLKPIGKKIAAKLHSLPLAAVVVGSSLRRTKRREDWENILESDWWEFKNIVSSLGVGFHNLDLDLKQCFMYCSLFPRNHVFDKDRLVQMWIAQGFIHPTKGEKTKLENKEIEIEDIGRIKFDKLVDRFFFQSTESKNLYVMHDLIREFATAISSDMFYYVNGRLEDNTAIPSSVRHLAFDPNTNPVNTLADVNWNHKHRTCLRTIMFLRYSHLDERRNVHFEKLVGLRLLDISFLQIFNSEFPRSKYQLSHLRFLDLSFSGIPKISTSLCDLVHLQVLVLRGHNIIELPVGMNKLINLRHLYASLKTVKLLHGIGRLTNLQELEEFFVRKEEGFTISELAGLKSLRGQLIIRNLEEVTSKEEASLARLEDKKYLTSLIYYVGETATSSDQQGKVLEGLKPHKNIRTLGITKFMSVTLPSWIMEMNNLTGIELLDCWYVETLPPFGSLPSLEVLKLSKFHSITSIGEEFYGASDVIFPFLRELTFDGMYKWTTWSNPSNAGKRQFLIMGNWTTWSNPSNPEKRQFFPCLQTLKIMHCKKLSGVPLLYPNSSLEELWLDDCDIVVNNVGEYFPALTSLTRLNMSALRFMIIDLHCDHLCKLQALRLENIDIGELKGQISSLVNLNKLVYSSISEHLLRLEYIDIGERGLRAWQLQNTDNLCIEVHGIDRIPEVLFKLGMFPSLRTLSIHKYTKDEFTLFENSWLQEQSYLEDLRFSSCDLICLPPSLSTLPSLKKFTLEECPMIDSLPPNGLPQSLEELLVQDLQCSLHPSSQHNTHFNKNKIAGPLVFSDLSD